MSEKYLISIAIGPVQDFIASARRSRDLWFGSWLLSELSKVVAETISKKNLIFPSNLNGNVVNRILAIVDKNSLGNFENKCREAIKARLKILYEENFIKIKNDLKKAKLSADNFKEDVAISQINDLVEFYWAAVPYDENDKTIDENGKSVYEIARDRVENLLKARKATRNFEQVNELHSGKENAWGSNAPKSSLDGQRESVIEDDLIKNDEIKAQKIFGLRKKERLCGVGVLKRLAEKGTNDRFFSTSHIASLPLLSTLKKNATKQKAVKDYVDKLKELKIQEKDLGKVPKHLEHHVFGKYDGHLFFENRLADLPFENKASLDKAKVALKKFMKQAFGDANKKPLPYFALLQADGDRMGTVIDNQKTPDEHKILSEALSKFAKDVKAIVEKKKYSGCLIYSGGDDVLALLPLHTVLDCACELATKFKDDLKNFEFTDEKKNEKIKPTLSVGIAVCHHTEPLQDSLTTMRNAEKEAKKVKGKNALAIILSKRSGADTTIKGSWENDRKSGESFDKRLKWFIQLHLDEALPDGVAYQLQNLWLRLKDDTSLKKPMLAEAIRILKRKYSNQGTTKVSQDILDKIESLIGNQYASSRDLKEKLSLEDLFKEIIVARDFAKAYKQAGIEKIGGLL